MRILITGARGMLGHALMATLESFATVTGVDIDELDITDRSQCRQTILELHPDLVVHAAAFTRVDDCERERRAAMMVNGEGAGNVAQVCRTIGARMIYFSSDYVFDGNQKIPYLETDPPAPLSVYGASKLDGERRVIEALPNQHLIVRTSWLFGLHGANFIDTMIRLSGTQSVLRVVDDQIGSPTGTTDLALATRELIGKGVSGVLNVTNRGITSWHGLAVYALTQMGISTPVSPIKSSEYSRPAPRPSNSALSGVRCDQILGDFMPTWMSAVDRYLSSKYGIDLPKETIV